MGTERFDEWCKGLAKFLGMSLEKKYEGRCHLSGCNGERLIVSLENRRVAVIPDYPQERGFYYGGLRPITVSLYRDSHQAFRDIRRRLWFPYQVDLAKALEELEQHREEVRIVQVWKEIFNH